MEKEIRKSTGLADQATKRLRDFIVNEKYQPGDLLPGEIELSQKLGVSRTIIREALSRFRMMGIVESRRRRGMILTSPDILSGFELAIDGTWLEADTQRELFELRLMMEIGLSDLLFKKKTDRLMAKLSKIIDLEQDAKTEAERMKADADFHAVLYAATGNQTLMRFQKLLYPLLTQYAADKVEGITETMMNHTGLLEELRNGTPDSFRMAMRQHLEPHFHVQTNRD